MAGSSLVSFGFFFLSISGIFYCIFSDIKQHIADILSDEQPGNDDDDGSDGDSDVSIIVWPGDEASPGCVSPATSFVDITPRETLTADARSAFSVYERHFQ